MPSVSYIPNYFLQSSCNWCHFCCIANLLAYVAALFVTSVCRLLGVCGREGRARDSNFGVAGSKSIRIKF